MDLPHLRKTRTPEHVLADLALNYLERLVLECGWVLERFRTDYSIDAHARTFSRRGEVESGLIYFQVKARASLTRNARDRIPFDVDTRDLSLWLTQADPVVLVVFDGGSRTLFWEHVQGVFAGRSLRHRRTVRVHIPIGQRMDAKSIRSLGDAKNRVYNALKLSPESHGA